MSQNLNSEEETDLGEIVAALWAHKILIILFISLSIFLSGYYALTTEKRFTASAVFQIDEKNSKSGFSIPGELGALASLAGFSTGGYTTSLDLLLDRATRREFILDMLEKASLDNDPYFNTYDPNYEDPLWKATIKKMIGWQKTKQEKMPL